MYTFSDLITEWIDGHPSRSPAALHRLTGVSKTQIGRILRGRKPSLDEALRIGTVLPAEKVMKVMNEEYPCWRNFILRMMSTSEVAA